MESPSPLNPFKVKGAGESDTFAAPAAIASVVEVHCSHLVFALAICQLRRAVTLARLRSVFDRCILQAECPILGTYRLK